MMGDGARLALAMNFGAQPASYARPQGRQLFVCGSGAGGRGDMLPGRSFAAFLAEPR
jgi:hypothetical protein